MQEIEVRVKKDRKRKKKNYRIRKNKFGYQWLNNVLELLIISKENNF